MNLTGTMSQPRFPLEVIHEIISHLSIPEDVATLAAMSQLSWAMCYTYQPILYRHLPFLAPPTNPAACATLLLEAPLENVPTSWIPRSIRLLRSLTLHPTLAKHVRSFTIQRLCYLGDPTDFANSMEKYYECLLGVLKNMENLKEISITTDDFYFYIPHFKQHLLDYRRDYGDRCSEMIWGLMDIKTDLLCFVKAVLDDKGNIADSTGGPPILVADLSTNTADSFFVEEILEALDEGLQRRELVKITVDDQFTPDVYFSGVLSSQTKIKSLILHGNIPLLHNEPEWSLDRSFHFSSDVLPELERFEGGLEDYFCLLPHREQLKEVCIASEEEEALGTFGKIGEELIKKFENPNILSEAKSRLRKITRLEIVHPATEDFRFLQLQDEANYFPNIFDEFASLRTLVLPATFTHFRAPETVHNLARLPNLSHLIIGATAEAWNDENCPSTHDWTDIVWGHLVNAMHAMEVDRVVKELFKCCLKLRCVDLKTHLHPDAMEEQTVMCGCGKWKLGRLMYVNGACMRAGRGTKETQWGDDLSKIL